jgi:CheY-like chemotaxis protein
MVTACPRVGIDGDVIMEMLMGTLRKALVVTGDAGVAQGLEGALAGAGFSVVAVADGAQALKTIAAEDQDLVFVDLEGDGAAHSIAKMKALQPWTPVVAIAAGGDRAAGAAAILTKPLTAEAIAAELRRLVQTTPRLADPAETVPAAKRKGGVGRLILSALVAGASAIALPFVALAGVLWIAAERAAAEDETTAGEVGATRILLFFVGPFVALAYMAAMPIVGLRELVRLGERTETAAGRAPGRGLSGFVRHLFVGGRAWIAAAP